MAAILYQVPVEKQRFTRILCGFFHLGTSKAHKYRVFLRLPFSNSPPEQLYPASCKTARTGEENRFCV
jgi:hypothetical protein